MKASEYKEYWSLITMKNRSQKGGFFHLDYYLTTTISSKYEYSGRTQEKPYQSISRIDE